MLLIPMVCFKLWLLKPCQQQKKIKFVTKPLYLNTFWELVSVGNNRFCGLHTHRWNNNKSLDHHWTTLVCLVPIWLFGGWILIHMKILHPTYTCLVCVLNTWHTCAKCANPWKNNFPMISITKHGTGSLWCCKQWQPTPNHKDKWVDVGLVINLILMNKTSLILQSHNHHCK